MGGEGEVDAASVRLVVWGVLEHRDVVLRTTSAAIRLMGKSCPSDVLKSMQNSLISAVGEAFNNICFHGYRDRGPGPVEIALRCGAERFEVELRDYGTSFDPRVCTLPNLHALPESGLGVFILLNMVDSVDYTAGVPNILRLARRCR